MTLSSRERMLRTIPEAKFQRDVEDLLTAYGWRWFHAPANRPGNGHVVRVRPGFPDLCAVRGERLLFAELKTQTGKPTPEQIEWLGDLQRAGVEAYLWRPMDMLDIRDILAARTSPGVSKQ